MTTKELTDITVQNTLAIAEHNKAMAEHDRATAENNKAIAQLTSMLLSTHESIKSLATTAAAQNEAISALSREWQAYIKTLPKT